MSPASRRRGAPSARPAICPPSRYRVRKPITARTFFPSESCSTSSSGQLPFKGVHETALMYEIVNVDPPPMSAVKPEIDPALDAIVLECLDKDPNERTQSVKQLSIDLKRFKRESSRSRVSRITSARPAYQPPSAGPRGAQQTTAETPALRTSGMPAFLPWIVSALLALRLGGIAFVHFRETPPDIPSITSS